MKLPITSLTPFTFQDFPEHTACILWFSGCNMSCGYCHNPELVEGMLQKIPFGKVQEFLESRRGKLDGVVLSGGECTLSRGLPAFIRYLKGFGFKVKVDTNGTHPDMLARLISDNLLDYVALDFKAPEAKFAGVTGLDRYGDFHRSLCLLCESGVPLEVRTTVHTDMLNEDDINDIISTLNRCGYKGTYFIQKFRQNKTLANMPAPSQEFDMAKIRQTALSIGRRNFDSARTCA